MNKGTLELKEIHSIAADLKIILYENTTTLSRASLNVIEYSDYLEEQATKDAERSREVILPLKESNDTLEKNVK